MSHVGGSSVRSSEVIGSPSTVPRENRGHRTAPTVERPSKGGRNGSVASARNLREIARSLRIWTSIQFWRQGENVKLSPSVARSKLGSPIGHGSVAVGWPSRRDLSVIIEKADSR